MYRKSYFLYEYRYISRKQCVVSPTFCRTKGKLTKKKGKPRKKNKGKHERNHCKLDKYLLEAR